MYGYQKKATRSKPAQRSKNQPLRTKSPPVDSQTMVMSINGEKLIQPVPYKELRKGSTVGRRSNADMPVELKNRPKQKNNANKAGGLFGHKSEFSLKNRRELRNTLYKKLNESTNAEPSNNCASSYFIDLEGKVFF